MVKQRDFVGLIVIGGIVVIAFVLFMGWYSQGLTPEQIELLKAKRDAMALPVTEPRTKKEMGSMIDTPKARLSFKALSP